MSFPQYLNYQDSGVEWLSHIPAHWSVSQSRRMFKVRSESALPDDQMLTASQKYGVLPQAEFVLREGRRVVEVIQGKESLKHVEPNDFIISMRSFQGGIEWCRLRGSTSFHYVMLTPIKWVYPAFFAYLLKSTPYIQALRRTTDLIRDGQELRFSNFAQVPLPVFPLDEQATIAAFLDRETAKIDTLITEQEKLIVLLAEKRQATISHAVTRGLNPNAPMKCSGVDWMLEVPAHWDVCLLKTRFLSVDYGISDSLSAEGSVAVLRMGNIAGGQVLLDDLKYVDVVDAGLLLEHGDLLFNRTNSLALVGKVGLFEGADFPVSFASYLVRIRVKPNNVAKYYSYLLNAPGLLGDVRSRAFEAIGQCNLNPTRYGQLLVAIPSQHEQLAIAAFLDVETARIDALIGEAECAISLLQERRSALITAAVTGQIDVRGLVKDEAA